MLEVRNIFPLSYILAIPTYSSLRVRRPAKVDVFLASCCLTSGRSFSMALAQLARALLADTMA